MIVLELVAASLDGLPRCSSNLQSATPGQDRTHERQHSWGEAASCCCRLQFGECCGDCARLPPRHEQNTGTSGEAVPHKGAAMSSLAALQAENARLKAENQRLQAALAARDTDADLLQTLGRSPPRRIVRSVRASTGLSRTAHQLHIVQLHNVQLETANLSCAGRIQSRCIIVASPNMILLTNLCTFHYVYFYRIYLPIHPGPYGQWASGLVG